MKKLIYTGLLLSLMAKATESMPINRTSLLQHASTQFAKGIPAEDSTSGCIFGSEDNDKINIDCNSIGTYEDVEINWGADTELMLVRRFGSIEYKKVSGNQFLYSGDGWIENVEEETYPSIGDN